MTIATATETKTFIVRYPVTTYYAVKVVRDADITEEALLQSVTREEITHGESEDDCAWDSIKNEWRECNAEVMMEDEDGCYDYAF